MVRDLVIDRGADARLTRHDRCDGCGAAAQVRALLPSGAEFLFCGHHARKHGPRLREIGAALRSGL